MFFVNYCAASVFSGSIVPLVFCLDAWDKWFFFFNSCPIFIPLFHNCGMLQLLCILWSFNYHFDMWATRCIYVTIRYVQKMQLWIFTPYDQWEHKVGSVNEPIRFSCCTTEGSAFSRSHQKPANVPPTELAVRGRAQSFGSIGQSNASRRSFFWIWLWFEVSTSEHVQLLPTFRGTTVISVHHIAP